MATKKIQIRPQGDNDYGDILYPETSADMVIDEVNGGSLQDHLNDATSHVPFLEATWEESNHWFKVTIPHETIPYGYGFSFMPDVENPDGRPQIGIYNKHGDIIEYQVVYHSGFKDVKEFELMPDCIYTVRYSGTAFFLQGAEGGGEYGTATAGDVIKGTTLGTENGVVDGTLELTGTATAAHVLNSATFYSKDAKTKLVGNMPSHVNNASSNNPSAATRTSSTSGSITLSPAKGYYSGAGDSITRISDANFKAANIKSGVSMFGITGTLASAARVVRTSASRGVATGTPKSHYFGVSSFNTGLSYIGGYALIIHVLRFGDYSAESVGILYDRTANTHTSLGGFAYDGDSYCYGYKDSHTLTASSMSASMYVFCDTVGMVGNQTVDLELIVWGI